MGAGWIGVDLDGTLAHYDGLKGINHIGEPVPLMLRRVITWLAEGREVKVMTARVCTGINFDGSPRQPQEARYHISKWCIKHLGQVLEVTHEKDFGMIELWDDRCVQVIPNTGERVDGKS